MTVFITFCQIALSIYITLEILSSKHKLCLNINSFWKKIVSRKYIFKIYEKDSFSHELM